MVTWLTRHVVGHSLYLSPVATVVVAVAYIAAGTLGILLLTAASLAILLAYRSRRRMAP